MTSKIIRTSTDGLVGVTQIPSTQISGTFGLIDMTTGRPMTQGEYEDYSRPISAGTMTGERVPANVWASANALMHQIMAEIAVKSAARDACYAASIDARYSDASAALAADMDSADSNN